MAAEAADIDMDMDDAVVDVEQEPESEVMEQKIINEEYKTWKKNSPFLYDMILSSALEWPTLTVQWFPDVKHSSGDRPYSIHRLLIGTHTSNDAQNYLQIARVEIPEKTVPDPAQYDEERGEIGGYGAGGDHAPIKMTIEQKITHPGEVNKARYQPQNANVIATMCADGRTLIFDRTKHTSQPTGTVSPQAELIGHKKEGYGLSWDPRVEGHLATGSEDMTVKLWDLTTLSHNGAHIKASRTYTHHTAVVNDVQHHPLIRNLIGTVSDDLTLQIIDTRKPETTTASLCAKDAHSEAINALAFNPASEFVIATASADKTIGIWDLRNLKSKLHTLQGHNDVVTSLSWHPHEEPILASGSYDRRVIFWDLSRIGIEQTPDDEEDGVPELLFMHGGHTNHLADFSWNQNEPWLFCSAAEDNLIQIWKVAEAIVGVEQDEIPVDEVEA